MLNLEHNLKQDRLHAGNNWTKSPSLRGTIAQYLQKLMSKASLSKKKKGYGFMAGDVELILNMLM
ncbi:hypothetical protein C7B62_18375 [Pleurocapsa sp. CCALA 161]|uniref:hypothetical protein n=1 Tax=Pleurocapsa sp. CCALA 161 TaxID=2107688 RepID=UPI000D04EDC7|nr:hypothetical protein [Pleurocapsa sp. CCALA 161]PSB07937.1 hypothetical protein C7B62_18375 [Pleurocapsa sp. CCALA 161]